MKFTEKTVHRAHHFAAYGFNEQACYDLFLRSSVFRENFLIPTVEVGQGGPDARVPVYYWDPASRLWRAANDATVAVLYYDWVREVLRNVVRKAASVEDSAPIVGSPLPPSGAARHLADAQTYGGICSSLEGQAVIVASRQLTLPRGGFRGCRVLGGGWRCRGHGGRSCGSTP